MFMAQKGTALGLIAGVSPVEDETDIDMPYPSNTVSHTKTRLDVGKMGDKK